VSSSVGVFGLLRPEMSECAHERTLRGFLLPSILSARVDSAGSSSSSRGACSEAGVSGGVTTRLGSERLSKLMPDGGLDERRCSNQPRRLFGALVLMGLPLGVATTEMGDSAIADLGRCGMSNDSPKGSLAAPTASKRPLAVLGRPPVEVSSSNVVCKEGLPVRTEEGLAAPPLRTEEMLPLTE
jgi:hypothetical protein